MKDIDIKVIHEWTDKLHEKLTEEEPLNRDDVNEIIKIVEGRLLELNGED